MMGARFLQVRQRMLGDIITEADIVFIYNESIKEKGRYDNGIFRFFETTGH